MLSIRLLSIMVSDQDKAVAFYTDVLGFQKLMDFPAGEYRWITVGRGGAEEPQLSLEPNANPAGKAFQEAMFAQGIPVLALQSSDLDAEYARLTAAGAAFTKKPTEAGPVKIAIVSDTVGNLVQLYQML